MDDISMHSHAERGNEVELIEELSPLLRKMAKGKDISGLEVYDV